MARATGVHHFAICTKQMKEQIEFFSDVLGMDLVALYWMHGVENTCHSFLRLNDVSSLTFVQQGFEKTDEMPEFGQSHAGSPLGISAPGTMQHVAFSVDTEEELLAMRDRVRSRGIQVLGHIDHGFGKSIYFAGLEGLTLEVATSEGMVPNPEAWIDPEVVGLLGIDDTELAAYKKPADYESPAEAVPQPAMAEGVPNMAMPPEELAGLMGTPDEMIFQMMSETEPPVANQPSALQGS